MCPTSGACRLVSTVLRVRTMASTTPDSAEAEAEAEAEAQAQAQAERVRLRLRG
jgi:hypothetical protein